MLFIHKSALGHHGNLKPSNCLIDRHFSIRLTDFGLKSLLDQCTIEKAEKCGIKNQPRVSLYLAPEVLINGSGLPNTIAQKADVYAFAIILRQLLLNSESPWSDQEISSHVIAGMWTDRVKRCCFTTMQLFLPLF